MASHKKTRPRGNADRDPKLLILADSVSENIPNPFDLQARLLAVRFGLAPGMAELVAQLAFSTREGASR